jgi:hypothetical protein
LDWDDSLITRAIFYIKSKILFLILSENLVFLYIK